MFSIETRYYAVKEILIFELKNTFHEVSFMLVIIL